MLHKLAALILAAWSLESISSTNPQALAAEARVPNIVFILADDLGWADLGCYGRRDQRTTHLDRLAAEGILFTSAYCAMPLCSASRAAILTGRSPSRLHITTYLPGRGDAPSQQLLHPRIQSQLPLEEVTLAERLKAAGYATACIGKWHLGGAGFSPREQGFDVYYPGQANTTPSASEGSKGEFDLTEQARRFMAEHKDRPFFLYLPHNNPHVPYAAPPEQAGRHSSAYNPVYSAVIESLDESVGRLLAGLDELGLAENTLVVFTSDNGGLHVLEGPHTPATTNGPFRAGKGHIYEGGLRVPAIVRWPGTIPAGKVYDDPMLGTAWPPTLLAAAGIDSQDSFDSPSYWRRLLGEEPAPAVKPAWHFPHYSNQGGRPAGAIRDGDWKLIEHYEDGRLELFNLADDPGEAQDRSNQEPARVAQMRGELESARRAEGVQYGAPNPHFDMRLWKPLYVDLDSSRLSAAATSVEQRERLAPWRQAMNQVLDKKPPTGEAARSLGLVVLHSRDVKTHGEKLQYEPPPHKDTLGYWVVASDWAEWTFELPHAGRYEIEVLQGCGTNSGGSTVEIAVADQSVEFKVEETGHFQRFVPRTVGTVSFDRAGSYTLTLRAKAKPGVAVGDFRQIVLRGSP